MFKIIWNKEEVEKIRAKLSSEYDLVLTDDPNEVPNGKVGIILDDSDLDKIRPILELMAIERSQIMFQTPSGFVQFSVHEMTYLEAKEKIFTSLRLT
ncbi:MAG: hypothetical protein ABH890_04150 [Bacillota bacterium]